MDAAAVRPRNPSRLLELQVADDPAAWAGAGFSVEGDAVRIDPATVRLIGRPLDGTSGIVGWTVSGLAIAGRALDGLRTEEGSGAQHRASGPSATHPNGAVGLDHVVVTTPDLDRTIGACEAAGLELRRIRETAMNGSPMRQAFFKLGPVVLEVVSGDVGVGRPAADAPATFWGIAVDVTDLDETAAALGDGLGRIKAAVQRGRRIATLRTRDFDVSVPIAAMDHHADRLPSDDAR
jgi:hypothetical protein